MRVYLLCFVAVVVVVAVAAVVVVAVVAVAAVVAPMDKKSQLIGLNKNLGVGLHGKKVDCVLLLRIS